MKKEDFTELLTDLYLAYNPDFIKFVPQLAEKYNRLEFDAIQNVLIKYNHESYNHYDVTKSTDDYIHSLIKDYSEGNRSLKGFTVEMQIIRNKEKEVGKSAEQKSIEEEAKKRAQEELSEIKNQLGDTEKKIEDAQKKLDDKLSKINQQLEKVEPKIQRASIYDGVEISIKSNYTDSELNLPNKEVLAGLGKGTRLIVPDKDGKMVGLIIEEIYYDCISHPLGTPIVEIIINKH
jgi:vacuolar-type H+-ATPase subunit I/STV1